MGEGLSFSDGEKWRKKRMTISKVFTFELLKANIPKISEICDKVLDEMEAENKTGDNEYQFLIKEIGPIIFGSVIIKCFLGIDDPK